MDSYLLEYRFSGYPRQYFLDQYKHIKYGFAVGKYNYHFVPHITIAGPIKAIFQRSLINMVEKVIFKYAKSIHEKGNLVGTGNYTFFSTNDGRNAIAVEIIPPKPLREMKLELEKVTNQFLLSKCTTYDEELWHSTLLLARKNNNFDNEKIKKIWWEVKEYKPQQMQFILDRITLMKNKQILKEFDLVNETILEREESLDNQKRYNSYLEIKRKLEAKGENFKYSIKNE